MPVVPAVLPPPPGKVAVTPTPGAVVASPLGVVTVLVIPPGVVTVAPPPPRKVEVVGGVSGATGGTWGAGVPMADGGSVLGVVTGLDGEAVSDWPLDTPEVSDPPEPVNDLDDVAEKLEPRPPP